VLPENDLLRADRRDEATEAHRQAVLDQRVVDLVRVAPLAHQAGRLQHTQMARDGRRADRKPVGDLTGVELTRAQVFEDLPTGGVGQCAEHTGFLGRAQSCHLSCLAH
jgi:hypothetical protein